MRLFCYITRPRNWLWVLVGLLNVRAYAYDLPRSILTGNIRHAQGRSLLLEWHHNPLTMDAQSITVTLSATGHFRVRLPRSLTYPAEITLRHGEGEVQLYVRAGDSLLVNVDARQFETTLHYSGTGAAANTYLARLGHQFPFAPGDSPETELAAMSPRHFRQLVDEHRRRRLRYWTTFERAHPALPADFRAYAQRAIVFEWATALLSYTVPPTGPKRLPVFNSPAQPDTTFRFLAQLRLPAPDAALREATYLGYLASYAVACLRPPDDTARWLPPLTREQARHLYTVAGQAFGHSRSRDVAVALAFYRQLLTHDAGAFAPQWAVFRQENRDSLLARTLGQAYKNRLPLAAGQPAPAFALQDTAGHIVRLSDLRGKVVYLEFWASWCGPCLAELPATASLKQHFEGQDVVFVYVSVDESSRMWKAALRRYRSLGGTSSVHLRDGGFHSPTVQAYQLAGVPAYWIIGRDGRIFIGNAPSPSIGTATINLIMGALQ